MPVIRRSSRATAMRSATGSALPNTHDVPPSASRSCGWPPGAAGLHVDAQPVPVELAPLPAAAGFPLDDHAVARHRQPLPIPRTPLHPAERTSQQRQLQRRIRQHRPRADRRERERQYEAHRCERAEHLPALAPPQRIVPPRDHAILEAGGQRREGNARHGAGRVLAKARAFGIRAGADAVKARNTSTPVALHARAATSTRAHAAVVRPIRAALSARADTPRVGERERRERPARGGGVASPRKVGHRRRAEPLRELGDVVVRARASAGRCGWRPSRRSGRRARGSRAPRAAHD